MKINKILFISICALSLAVNASLGFALLRPATPSVAFGAPKTVISGSTNTPASPMNGTLTGTLWSELSSIDLRKLVSNLQAAGFSPKMIRAIIQALVSEKYAERLLVARGHDKDTPYWKTSNTYYSGDKRMKESSRIYREMNKEVRAILGDISLVVGDENLPYLQRQYGSLPSDKLNKLMHIQEDYSEMIAEYQTGGTQLPADREKLKLLQQEQRADIAKLLTTEELFEYDLRNSPASWRLRGWNDSFDLAEAEYRALFPLYQKLEDQFPSDQGPSNAETDKARKTAEEQMQDQIKAALGDARYADYKQSRDPSAQQENRLVLRLGLPLTTASQLVEAKKDFQEKTKSIAKDKDLSGEQKKDKLAALAQASQDRVTSLIGEQGINVYREYGGGWLKSR